ncbi:hypothetical protein UR09_05945 [Candidatus Nitromaritima sp. SCGC AAA799-A02]|nr:hypothetical protein UR09_05945 [Candidatus Nitromaritima sp. SCGC AAA799-A02]KMP12354.1 hypothetical protein UZ36_01210 [Candidatus Nitromaritima sp. SCGC AAA799-C22]
MDPSIYRWFPSIESVITAFFALASLTVALRLMRRPFQSPLEIKLLGSLMTIGLAFGADHPAIYGFALIVVAILITDLKFLEKLGVLFGRQKPNYQYLLQPATPEEIAAKLESEFQQSSIEEGEKWHPDSFLYRDKSWTMNSEGTLQIKEFFLEEAAHFHDTIHRALKQGKGPFSIRELKEKITLSDRFSQLTFDVIVVSPYHHYVAEVRYIQHRDDLKKQLPQIERMVMAYRGYLSERNNNAGVTPIVIIPRKVNVANVFLGMLVLKFDPMADKFHNENEVIRILEAWEKAGI